jgi:hypothetical protein
MSESVESIAVEKSVDTHAPAPASPLQPAATVDSSFDPLVDGLFAGAPDEPPDAAARTLTVQRMTSRVLQRAQRLYGNRASQRFVMRSRALQRQCACGGMCPKCQEEEEQRALQRSSSAPAPAQFDGIPATQGQPLDPAARRPLEAHFGANLADVRVHTSSDAADSATRLDSLAYTSGRDIYFAAGMYAPSTSSGQRLLAHEVAHVVQQSSGKEPSIATKSAGVKIGAPDDPLESEAEKKADEFMSGAPTDEEQRKRRESAPSAQRYIQRQLDPTSTEAWDWYSAEWHRIDPSYAQTIAAAPGAASALVKGMADKPPETDEDREAVDQKILTLIRLNGVSMVGAHRVELMNRKQQFLEMAQKPAEDPQGKGSSENDPKSGVQDTALAIRGASQARARLNSEKSMLEDLKRDIESAVRVNYGDIHDEIQTLADKAQPDSSAAILQRVQETRSAMDAQGLAEASKQYLLMQLRDDLAAFRQKQIEAIDLSLVVLYNDFPFLADMADSDILGKHTSTSKKAASAFGLALSTIVPVLIPLAAYVAHDAFTGNEPPDDAALLQAVDASFGRLLTRTDEAIVKVGSGGINPLDLPGAVGATRNSLPPAMRTELDRIRQEHEVAKFEVEMILALGTAVLIGVTGGLAGIGLAGYATATGALATGAGVVQAGMQAKDMLDRQTIGGASTDPSGSLLGVSAPSMFEWAVLGVTAALTAADLASLAKEIGGLRPHFSQEPHLPDAEPQPGAPQETPGAPEGKLSPEGTIPVKDPNAENAVTYVNEHPESIHGDPGHREAQVGPDHTIKEESDPALLGVHCKYHSGEGIEVPCPKGMGDAAAAAPKPETKAESLFKQAEWARKDEQALPGIIKKLGPSGKGKINLNALNQEERDVLQQIFPKSDLEELTLDDVLAARGRSGAEAARLYEMGEEALFKQFKLRRPYLREPTQRTIENSTPRAPDGRYIDPDGVVRQPPWQYGHAYGRENRRLIIEAGEKNMTQEQFNEWVNSHPEWFRMESREYNESHAGEKPGID